MLRYLFVVCLVVASVYCQIGGTHGPCSAVAIPGPFSSPLSVFGSTVGASASAINCNEDDLDQSGTAWYSIVPSSGNTVSITSCSSYTNFDTVVIVYSGNCEALSCVILGDDTDCSINSEFGAVTFTSTGQQYFVAVVGYGTSSGQFELTFSESAPNITSTCQTAIAIPGPYLTPVTIFGNTQSSGGYTQSTCGLSSSSLIDWYLLNPQPGSQVEVTTCNSITNFDTRLAILTGTCGQLNCLASNDDNCTTYSLASYLTFVASNNQPSYYLAVFGYGTNAGNYEVRVVEYPVQSTPGGDCGTAILIPFSPSSGQLFFGSTANSPISSVSACSFIQSPSAWYRVDVPNTYSGTITASTCNSGTSFDTILSVYSGSCERLNCVTQNDDYSCSFFNLASTVFFDAFDALEVSQDRLASTTPSLSKSASSTQSNTKSRTPTPSRGANVPSPSLSRTRTPAAGTDTFYIQVAGFSTNFGNYVLSVNFS